MCIPGIESTIHTLTKCKNSSIFLLFIKLLKSFLNVYHCVPPTQNNTGARQSPKSHNCTYVYHHIIVTFFLEKQFRVTVKSVKYIKYIQKRSRTDQNCIGWCESQEYCTHKEHHRVDDNGQSSAQIVYNETCITSKM